MRIGAFLTVLTLAAAPLAAQINFTDNFSTGLSPTYWSVTEIPQNHFAIDTSSGKLSVAADGTTALEYAGFYLSPSALNFPVGGLAGNFSVSLTFSNADLSSASDENNVNLDAVFVGSADFFVDAYSNDPTVGPYVYGDVPSQSGPNVPTATNAGTFTICAMARLSLEHSMGICFSVTDTSPLASVSFGVESDDSTQPASADFENFTFTNTPEPATFSLILLAGPLMRLRRPSQRS